MPKANVAENRPYLYDSNIGPMWVRGPEEEYTVQEQSQYQNLVILPDDIVLDIGAHIGCAARYFLFRGARYVVALEPIESNFGLLTANLAQYPAMALKLAVTPETGPLTLWTPNTRFSTEHSVQQKRGRTPTEVQGVAFRKLFDYNPTVIKMDIEGGELDLIEEFANIYPQIHGVAMEVHYHNDEARQKVARLREIMAQHYDEIQPPRYLEKSWNTDIIIWEAHAGTT